MPRFFARTVEAFKAVKVLQEHHDPLVSLYTAYRDATSDEDKARAGDAIAVLFEYAADQIDAAPQFVQGYVDIATDELRADAAEWRRCQKTVYA